MHTITISPVQVKLSIVQQVYLKLILAFTPLIIYNFYHQLLNWNFILILVITLSSILLLVSIKNSYLSKILISSAEEVQIISLTIFFQLKQITLKSKDIQHLSYRQETYFWKKHNYLSLKLKNGKAKHFNIPIKYEAEQQLKLWIQQHNLS